MCHDEKCAVPHDIHGTRDRGFSLIELMVAMVIFMIVTGAIYGLLEVGRIDRNRASRRSDILKNARVAVHLIGRDALNAGLGYHRRGAVAPDDFVSSVLGFTADVDANRDMITSVISGDDLFTNNLQRNPSARTDAVAFAFRDVDFNTPPGTIVTLQNVTSPTGNPQVAQLVSKSPTGAADAQPFDLYLIESDTSQVAVMATAVNGTDSVDVAPGDPLGLNQPLNGTGTGGSILRACGPPVGSPPVPDDNCTTYLASLKRIFLVAYRVKADGTLVRITYGNNRGGTAAQQIQEQPLAYNVEDLQIDYVLEDGTVTGRPSAGPDGLVGTVDDDFNGFNMIRQINVRITVQATEADEQTKQTESITLTATFSARNMEYDAG